MDLFTALFFLGSFAIAFLLSSYFLNRPSKQIEATEINDMTNSMSHPDMLVQLEVKPFRYFKKRIGRKQYAEILSEIKALNQIERMYINRYGEDWDIFFMDWLPKKLKEINPTLSNDDIELTLQIDSKLLTRM